MSPNSVNTDSVDTDSVSPNAEKATSRQARPSRETESRRRRRERQSLRARARAARRSEGRAADADEWVRAVAQTVRADDAALARRLTGSRFPEAVRLLSDAGRLSAFWAFLPGEEEAETAREVLAGEHPTPRFLATCTLDWDLLPPERRDRVLRMYARYDANADPERERAYFPKLRELNPVAAAIARRRWRERNPQGADLAYERREAALGGADLSGRLARIMSLALAQGVEGTDLAALGLEVDFPEAKTQDPFADVVPPTVTVTSDGTTPDSPADGANMAQLLAQDPDAWLSRMAELSASEKVSESDAEPLYTGAETGYNKGESGEEGEP